MQEHTDLWIRSLLPHYTPGDRPTKRMEALWRQGLPPKVRETLWPIAIGNVLRVTPELFEIYKRQAADARARAQPPAANVLVTLSDQTPALGKEHTTELIPFDLPRTFPTLAFFREGGPLHGDCMRILEAYTFFRPDIGYVQGMSFLAAVLLLYLSPFAAFVGLCNLLNSPSVLGLYRLEPKAVQYRASIFRDLTRAQLPAVARVIEQADLAPEMFLIDWFMTIYAKVVPIDVASVVWDLFLLDGEIVLYCTALALFRIMEPALLEDGGADLEGCAKILGKDLRKRVTDPDELLWHIREVWTHTPPNVLTNLRHLGNTEFGSSGNPGLGALTMLEGSPGGLGSALASWKDSLFARWST